jgi:hypothetical protein
LQGLPTGEYLQAFNRGPEHKLFLLLVLGVELRA